VSGQMRLVLAGDGDRPSGTPLKRPAGPGNRAFPRQDRSTPGVHWASAIESLGHLSDLNE
jgi:hypothetical protein